jgi:CRISPR-associated endonuclease/helicase Cas3
MSHPSTTCIQPDEQKPAIAHVRQAKDGSFVVHDLEDHLRAVAKLAARHASAMDSADWAQLAGLWHDLGKYAKEFQRRIKSVSGYDPDAHLEGSVGRVMVAVY